MILTQEQELLKGQQQFQALAAYVSAALAAGQRIDEVERALFVQLLQLGHTLLAAFVAGHGNGDVGATCAGSAGQSWQRLPETHARRYVSIFGALTVTRFVYGTRAGQKIDAVPLDARLGLPAGEFSYVLEDWAQRLCLKESFAEGQESLAALLGVQPSVRSLEHLNRALAEFAAPFRQEQPRPPAAEEGPLLVVTADGKGVPMRRPVAPQPRHHGRRGKGEKANQKQMAYVGAVYSIARFVRSVDAVLDEVLRQERAQQRPQPQHKQVWAEMTCIVAGEVSNGRERLFGQLADAVLQRNHGGRKPMVCLLDGERALWDQYAQCFPEAEGILDLFHVLERLWLAAHCLHRERSPAAEQFVTDRLRMLLEGRVAGLITSLRQLRAKTALPAAKRRTLTKVIGYLNNNRAHMKYDQYLAAGYPIGSGVAEGACRHLVKDRMEQTGMRWTVDGAQALLAVRAIYLNGDWAAFLTHRVQQEQTELYHHLAV